MKIIAFIGSRRGKKSSNYKVTKILLDYLVEQNDLLEVEIVTADELNLQICRGCINCFKTGICLLDQKDKFNELKYKMEKASLIVFASPVYMHSITGDMKNVIDRLAYWSHLFKLAGIPAVSIVGSSCSGNDETIMYLNKAMELIGLDIIKTISFTVDYPSKFTDESFIKTELLNYSNEISRYLTGEKKVRGTDNQRKIFKALREQFKVIEASKYRNKSIELKYWKETEMLQCETYDEYIEKLNIYK
ncbi:MAG: flavodoxin family protein [Sarcina sp.]